MNEFVINVVFAIFALLIPYIEIREVVFSILLGTRSIKGATKLRKQQTMKMKISMKYIGMHINKYKIQYRKYMKLKKAWEIYTFCHIIELWILAKLNFPLDVYYCVVIVQAIFISLPVYVFLFTKISYKNGYPQYKYGIKTKHN